MDNKKASPDLKQIKKTKTCYRKGQDTTIVSKLTINSGECTNLIRNTKMSYILEKSSILNDKCTDPKVYWTVLNNFLNKIKITSVPPILKPDETTANIVKRANILMIFLLPSVLLWKAVANFLRY